MNVFWRNLIIRFLVSCHRQPILVKPGEITQRVTELRMKGRTNVVTTEGRRHILRVNDRVAAEFERPPSAKVMRAARLINIGKYVKGSTQRKQMTTRRLIEGCPTSAITNHKMDPLCLLHSKHLKHIEVGVRKKPNWKTIFGVPLGTTFLVGVYCGATCDEPHNSRFALAALGSTVGLTVLYSIVD